MFFRSLTAYFVASSLLIILLDCLHVVIQSLTLLIIKFM